MKKKEKPSHTALKVGLNIIALSHIEEMKNVLPDGIVSATSDLLKSSKAVNTKRIEKHHSPNIVKLYKIFDWMLPGQFEVFGYRKAFFEERVLDAIEHGASQVLVLGCGYDTLCYRLASKYPQVKFFEIDHPNTAISKLEGLVKLGKSNNHFVIPEDLSKKTLSEVLGANDSWNKTEKTIITAEGLLQYLPPSSVQNLFEQCSKITGDKSRIAFTYVGKGSDGRPYAGPRTGLMLWLLKISGEPWLWAANLNELKELLFSSGWQYSEKLTGENIKRGIEYFACAIKNKED
ncbi:MAG: SAM-dependent methyltransferase [Ignavibacteriae bacterium]|nr:SAM-dependent methyltransferase [Ignavibacteriota bacterium]